MFEREDLSCNLDIDYSSEGMVKAWWRDLSANPLFKVSTAPLETGPRLPTDSEPA